jgi:hypothetical protein
MQRETARSLAQFLARIAPDGSIASIFAGGSLGRGEVWAAQRDGDFEIYSDIDLYVVAQDAAAAQAIRRKLRDVSDLTAWGRFRPPDIGIYTRQDLAAQPLRPGTAELDTHHLMLYGDESIPRGLSNRSAAQIAPEEALYLLENRVLELTAPWLSIAPPQYGLFSALKAHLDVYSAHAIVDGTFACTLTERAERFRKRAPATLEGEARARVAGVFDSAQDIGAWMRDRSVSSECASAVHALADAWRTLAPHVLGMQGPVPALVARRCRAGAHLANARDVIRIRRATSRSLLRAALAAPVLSGRGPVQALRIDALAHVFTREARDARALVAHFRYVGRLTRMFGYTNGSLEERSRAMHAAVS